MYAKAEPHVNSLSFGSFSSSFYFFLIINILILTLSMFVFDCFQLMVSFIDDVVLCCLQKKVRIRVCVR